jgi:predicted MFS family arabinose efflux permease
LGFGAAGGILTCMSTTRDAPPPVLLVAPGLALIAVTYGLARYAYGLFLPEFREAFGLSAPTLGLIGAASWTAYCVGIVVALLFTSRTGPRLMAAAAGAFAVAGMAIVAGAPGAWVLVLGIVVAGVSSGLASPPLGEAVAIAVRPERRDRANALINSGTSAGVALSGPAALLAAQDWRAVWAGFAAVGLAVLVWNVKALPGAIPGKGRRAARRLPALHLLSRRSLPLLATAFAAGFASAAYWTFSRDLVVQAGGVSPSGSTLFWSVLGVCGLAGGAAGGLVARFGVAGALHGSLLAMAGAIALLAAGPTASVAVYASAAAFGASYVAISGLVLLWAVRVFAARPSAGIGAAFLLLAAGQVAGAPVAGGLAAAVGLGPTFAAFAGASALALVLCPRSAVARTG